MKKIVFFIFLLQIFFQNNTIQSQVVWQENFESYVVDSIIDPQTPDWIGWGGMYTSAFVSADTSTSGNQSLKSWEAVVPGSSVPVTDVVHLFGNITSGRYLLEFKLFIPSLDTNGTSVGTYYNILHDYQNNGGAGTEWAMEVYMYPKGSSSYLRAGGVNYNFNVIYDKWVQIAHIIDLNRDSADFYYGNKLIASHPFSYTSLTTSGKNQLGALDIYAECSGTNCIPLGYFDDFILRNLPDQSNDAGISDIVVPDYCQGFPTTLDVVVQNYGINAIDSLNIEWSIDGMLQPPVKYSSKSLSSGDTAIISLGSYFFGNNNNYNIKTWTSLPNNSIDTVNYNDTLTLNLGKLKIKGPYEVCPTIDFVLSASGTGIGSNYDWQYYDSTLSTWNSTGSTSKDYIVAGGITSSKNYRLIVSCQGGGTDTSGIISILLKPISECYCTPDYFAGCNFNNNIHSFHLSGVNGTFISDLSTGCSINGYDDKTHLAPIDLVAGKTHTGTINSSSTSLNEYAKIWIDFNDDGIFKDSTELVGLAGAYNNVPFTYTISIPSNADSGIHRMRVRDVWLNNAFSFSACSSESYGEAHDYMVNVIIPSCKVPSNLSSSNTTTNSTGLTWIENGFSTDWEVEYGIAGFMQGTGTLIQSNSNPLNLSGLNTSTSYEFYVRSICGRNDTSYWAGPYLFQTSADIPYFQDFENFPISFSGINNIEGWNNTSRVIPQWHSNSSTSSGGTGPIFDKSIGSGGRFIFIESSGGVMGDFDELLSPLIYVDPAYSTIHFSFWYHMYGATMGDIEVYLDANSTSTLLTTITGQQQTSQSSPWSMFSSALTGYQGQSIRIRFKGIRGSSFTSDMAVDDVRLSTTPVGTHEINNSIHSITIFPNPSNGILNVSGRNIEKEVEIDIYNVNGKLVYSLDNEVSKDFNKTIDLSRFSKGVYFIKLKGEDFIEMRKIIVQ